MVNILKPMYTNSQNVQQREEVSYMKYRMQIALAVFASIMIALPFRSAAQTTDEETLKQLKVIIEQQQKQLEAQQQAIEALQQKVDAPSQQEAPTTEPPEAAPVSAGIVKSSEDKVTVKLYGFLNRAVLVSDDGNDTEYYNVDNANAQSRFGIRGKAKITEDLAIGSHIELGLNSNLSSAVDQNNKNTDFDLTDRIIEMFLEDDRYGKLSLGQGHMASDGSSEVDLSGTMMAGYSAIAQLAGGQFFYDKNTQDLSSTRIRNVFDNMDGLGREDRARYDTPILHGFQVSGSINNDDGGDVTVRYSGKFGETLVAAAGAWASPADQIDDVDNQYNGSASVLFGMGLNFTVAGGYQDLDGSRSSDDATFIYGKVGYRREFFSPGDTAFALEFGRFNDIAQNDDEADTIGAHLVQHFDPWGAEWYLGYRHHTLDRDNGNFDDINTFVSGFRVKF